MRLSPKAQQQDGCDCKNMTLPRSPDDVLPGEATGNWFEEYNAVNMESDDSERIRNHTIGLDEHASSLSLDAASLSMLWVDAARLSRECITNAVMVAQPGFMIHAVKSLEECLSQEGLKPELVVYYSHAEETVDIHAIEALHAAYPAARLVVLSDASTLDPALVRHVLSQNVAGFILTRRTGLQMVVSAISLVHSGGTFVPRDFLFMEGAPSNTNGIRKTTENGRFTQRELAVLELIRLGQPNKLIAEELGMSASTVKVHVRNIMQKMGVANRTKVAMGAEDFLKERSA
ncbi:response regulator transcription factor [Acidisoma cellulosilytica]|uniref:Response regulator transcription factor n=1 Tax=Acidisoma cellulosilyticum TaxID=2802395 RepID=A0A963Z4H5_9PROT|nr:response regulator transcription factor [Acidisoma cellulosilyticum]MCB8881757.1 response regulator transcription factor [Acidisoma cellulosilyticum]